MIALNIIFNSANVALLSSTISVIDAKMGKWKKADTLLYIYRKEGICSKNLFTFPGELFLKYLVNCLKAFVLHELAFLTTYFVPRRFGGIMGASNYHSTFL